MITEDKDMECPGVSGSVAGTALWITIGMVVFILAGLVAVRLGVGWEKSLYETSIFGWIAVHYFSGVGVAVLCILLFKK